MKPPFKLGDRVRVKSIPEENNDWISEMQKTIGKSFIVKRIDSCWKEENPIGLDVPGASGEDDMFWYRPCDLELVDALAGDLEIMQKRLTTIEKKILQFDGEIGKLVGDYREGLIREDDQDLRQKVTERGLAGLEDRINMLDDAQDECMRAFRAHIREKAAIKEDPKLEMGDWAEVRLADNPFIGKIGKVSSVGERTVVLNDMGVWDRENLRKLPDEEITRRLNA